MDTFSPLNILLLSTGFAATFSVFWYGFRRTDQIEKERSQRNRMNARLMKMLRQSSK